METLANGMYPSLKEKKSLRQRSLFDHLRFPKHALKWSSPGVSAVIEFFGGVAPFSLWKFAGRKQENSWTQRALESRERGSTLHRETFRQSTIALKRVQSGKQTSETLEIG